MLNGRRTATATIRLPERWREWVDSKGEAFEERIAISDEEAAREHLLMNLRLGEGIDLAAYERRWGIRPAGEKITTLAQQGMLESRNDILRATPQGRLVLNRVIAELTN